MLEDELGEACGESALCSEPRTPISIRRRGYLVNPLESSNTFSCSDDHDNKQLYTPPDSRKRLRSASYVSQPRYQIDRSGSIIAQLESNDLDDFGIIFNETFL